ncbi:hypothetical protein ACQQ2Q_20385 [Agrobacterium sp. ES01]|uniref:hypothetical protein n=1 Tax=Agrobacterium sp. ES01 TaxID=3420714 RepID=UPI003D13486E
MRIAEKLQGKASQHAREAKLKFFRAVCPTDFNIAAKPMSKPSSRLRRWAGANRI